MATLSERISAESDALQREGRGLTAAYLGGWAQDAAALEAEVARLRGIQQRAEQAHKLMAFTRSEEFIGHLQDGAREMPLSQYWTDGATDMLMWVLGWTRPGRWFRWLLDKENIVPDPTGDAEADPQEFASAEEAMVPRRALERYIRVMAEHIGAFARLLWERGDQAHDLAEIRAWRALRREFLMAGDAAHKAALADALETEVERLRVIERALQDDLLEYDGHGWTDDAARTVLHLQGKRGFYEEDPPLEDVSIAVESLRMERDQEAGGNVQG